MGTEISRYAIGIGAQVDQATVNSVVRDATGLTTGVAAGSDATGIHIRSDDDIDINMTRLAADLGTVPGSLTRLGSAFRSVEPSLSFTIDMMGNRFTPATPASGEFDLDEYMIQILEGARLVEETPASDFTPYEFSPTALYKTLKVWRATESWTFVGCTFDLSLAFVAGFRAPLTITVFADSVIHDDTEVFPTTDSATAFGNQLGAPPIFENAEIALDEVSRGMQTATLTITYERGEIGDANFPTGIRNTVGPSRTVELTANWYGDDAQDDFAFLETDLGNIGTSPLRLVRFRLGQEALAGDTINAFLFRLQNFEYETNNEVVNGEDVVRGITGHAVAAGDTGIGSGPDDEFRLLTI